MKNLLYVLPILLSACSTVPADIQAINKKWNALPYVPEVQQKLTSCDYFKEHGGDCEEFAICKQQDLFNAYYLDATVKLGYTGKGEPHAITYVQGWYLDNRTDRIGRSPYDFKEM